VSAAPSGISAAKYKVLRALLADANEPHYGYALMRATGVRSGSLYPILEQLERASWVTAEWESTNDGARGRPPRRWYRLTGSGRAAAAEVTARFRAEIDQETVQPRTSLKPRSV
jgi:DNA-binding PadR family transcriptional regulator